MAKRKIPETITQKEFTQILQNTKSPKKKLAYSLGFYQGMRISEVTKLRPEHINYQQRQIMIKQAKGNKDRNIPIAPETLRGLKHLPVGVGIRALQISFKKAAQKTLGKDLHFHCLRHSSATHYLNVKKWSIRAVQRFLGHAHLSTTEIYTHVNDQDLMNEMWNQK